MPWGDWLANKTEKIQLFAPAGPTQNERRKKKMKEKAKVNDCIRIYTACIPGLCNENGCKP